MTNAFERLNNLRELAHEKAIKPIKDAIRQAELAKQARERDRKEYLERIDRVNRLIKSPDFRDMKAIFMGLREEMVKSYANGTNRDYSMAIWLIDKAFDDIAIIARLAEDIKDGKE